MNGSVSRVGVAGILVALLLLTTLAVPASAARPSFGAKLDSTSGPTDFQDGFGCYDFYSLRTRQICTWVATKTYQNGSHYKAPKNGRIGRVQLVSCVAGHFRLQLARWSQGADKAKVVRDGPTIRYHADARQTDGDIATKCGGDAGTDFKVQTFRVNVPVKRGEYIAIKTKFAGPLSCWVNDGIVTTDGIVMSAPPLLVGKPAKTPTVHVDCLMLVRLIYK